MNELKSQESNSNNTNFQQIIGRLNEINQKIENQNLRLNKLEAQSSLRMPMSGNQNVTQRSNDEFSKPLTQPVVAKVPETPVRQENIEEKIAGNWFAKIGILAVVIGVAFFLKYAFDNNWINEYSRIAIGVILGGALFAVGIWLTKKFFVYGQILAGGGLGILYLSFFAAYNFYHLISYPVSFLAISIVTIIAILFSIYRDTPSLAYIAVIMAFLTPFLLWSGENNQIGLFTYSLILDLAIIAISLIKKEQVWGFLSWLGFIATEAVFLVWQTAYWTQSQFSLTMFFLCLFFLIFSILPIIKLALNRDFIKEESIAYSLIVGGVFFLHAYYLMFSGNMEISVLPLFLAVYYGVLSLFAYLINKTEKNFYSFFIALTILFAVVFIPIYFHGQMITYFWLLELVLVSFLASRFKNVSYMAMTAIIGVLAVVRLFSFDISITGDFLFNGRLALFLTATIAFYLSAIFFTIGKRTTESKEEFSYFRSMQIAAITMANLFTIYAFNREIEYYFQSIDNHDAGAIALSLWWLIYSIVIIVVGFVGKFKKLRLGGLILLFLAILKLFFYDLWSLGQLYRIVSSIALGVVLLLVSFGYQKYKHLINDLI